MSDGMKYIVVVALGHEQPVIFSPLLEHYSVAGNRRVVSAGRCRIYLEDGKLRVWCGGGSVSLKLVSRGKQDAALILSELERHCE